MSRTLFNDPLLAKIISKMKFSPDDSVLDYGCGAGDYTHAISKYSKKVVGVDINIKKASTKYPSSNFKKQIGIKLDFPNNHFDKIVCVNTIEHVHLFKDLLKELKRVLKPGGKIFITTYDTDFIGNKILFDETHVFEWNKNSFCKFISSHLRVERCFCTGSFFNFFPLNWLMVYVFKPEICVIARKGQEN